MPDGHFFTVLLFVACLSGFAYMGKNDYFCAGKEPAAAVEGAAPADGGSQI